ncbi:hypothetical protein H8959_000019 [Pygathrix nigripes]
MAHPFRLLRESGRSGHRPDFPHRAESRQPEGGSTWANEVEDRRPQYTTALNLNPSHTHPPRPLTTFLRRVMGIQISPGLVAAGGTVAWRILRQLWEDVDCLTGGWESRVQKEKLGVQDLVTHRIPRGTPGGPTKHEEAKVADNFSKFCSLMSGVQPGGSTGQPCARTSLRCSPHL